MRTNKTGMGSQEQRGGTGVLDEEKKAQQGNKYHGDKLEDKSGQEKSGEDKSEQGKHDFRHDKGGTTERSHEQKK